jgi:hypothetical protein
MGHDQCGSLKDDWFGEEQYCTPLCPNMMACDHFHILRFCHFENNNDPPNCDNRDRLWKIRKIFGSLNNKFCEIYNPTEHSAVDEVIMFYKGRVIFLAIYCKETQKIWYKNLQTLCSTCMTRMYTLFVHGESYYLSGSFCYIEQKIYLFFCGRLQFKDTTQSTF